MVIRPNVRTARKIDRAHNSRPFSWRSGGTDRSHRSNEAHHHRVGRHRAVEHRRWFSLRRDR